MISAITFFWKSFLAHNSEESISQSLFLALSYFYIITYSHLELIFYKIDYKYVPQQ